MRYKLALLTGLILLAVALFKLKGTIDFIGRSERANGLVVGFIDSDDAYSPVFTVSIKGSAPVTYHHPAATSPASWRVGEEATFLYDPRNPDNVKMMSYFWLFDWSIVLTGLAIPFLVISIGYYLLKPLTKIPMDIYPDGYNKSIR